MSTPRDPNQPVGTRVKVSGWVIVMQLTIAVIVLIILNSINSTISAVLQWVLIFYLLYRLWKYLRHNGHELLERVRATGFKPADLPGLAIAFWRGETWPFKQTTSTTAAAAAGSSSGAPEDGVALGRDAEGKPVVLSDRQLASHGLILGATGSGKTTTLLSVLCQQIQHGAPVVAIDLKGSGQFRDTLKLAADRAGRPFVEWNPDGPTHWNPLAYGGATELKDKLISAEKFTEPHYQRAAERYLQTALQVLQAVAPDRPVTLASVVGLLDPNTLKAMLAHAPQELVSRAGPYVTALNRDQLSGIMGLQSRLAILSESSVGEFLQPGDPQIDLHHTLTGGDEVVLFSLSSSRYGKLTGQLAAMIVQDLIAITADRENQPGRRQAFIALDEFSALDADNILNLFARSRSAGMSVLLSTQELADLQRLADGFQDQVVGNLGVFIAHRQNVPQSAELIAEMIGTETRWKTTTQTEKVWTLTGVKTRGTGMGTTRQVEEFKIHPNLIKNLGIGQAIVITKIPVSNARPTSIHSWSPR